jgi:tRNA threonylcarbamoyl adenosine modification protein YeaZ
MLESALVLAVDTATVVTVGLARGETYLGGHVVDDRLAQVEQLMPTIAGVVDRAGVSLREVDEIVVGLGPGPFTGLRVGVVTAQVLAATLGVRLHGICSLDVIAAAHATETRLGSGEEFLVATDARRKEVYWARYAAEGTRLDGPAVGRPDLLPDLPTVGPGADLYPNLARSTAGPRRIDPRSLAVLGPDLPDAGSTPLYLRRPDAAVPTRRKSVLLRRADRGGRPA